MGLLDFLPVNPATPFIKGLQRPLNDIGHGLMKGKTWQKGLAEAADYSERQAPYRQAEALRQEEITQAAESKNQTIQAMLEAGREDLANMAEAGYMEQAWKGYLDHKQQEMKGGDPFTLSPDQVRYNPDGTVLAQGPAAQPDPKDQLAVDKENFDRESALWKEYMAAEPVKTYQALKNSYERIRQSAATDSGPGDLGLIFNYMKMLDPGSVVREGEFATAENAGGVGAQISNLYNRVINGERLTPELRQQFIAAADRLYQEASSNVQMLNDQMGTRANAWGVDPSRILSTPEVYEPIKVGVPTATKYPGVTITKMP